MRVIVVGLGVQGRKRRRFAGGAHVASVDPINPEADYRDLREVPLDRYDAVLACVPDGPKIALLTYCIERGKHVLVEKPLWAEREAEIAALEALARRHDVVCYTAYNHRFEPHVVRMRDLLRDGTLGRIYSVRMFYGNGTARLVRDSDWRDAAGGVLPDLGSHLLDTCLFWFDDVADDFTLVSSFAFENRAPDHVVIESLGGARRISLEMTLLMWRNHFTCDILAENGSAHITSLCKWGPSAFIHRERVLPSGRPPETCVTLVQDDPTWELEYRHFVDLCRRRVTTDLAADRRLHRMLARLGEAAAAAVRRPQ